MLKAFSITDIGKKRKVNQDYIFESPEPIGKLPNLFIVADGMGGHNAGDYASECAVKTMVEKASGDDSDSVELILQNAVIEANAKVVQKASEDISLHGMGTTVVAAVCQEGRLTAANVGDSRLYLLREGSSLRQITRDHSLVEELVRLGTLTSEQARVHPSRNIITRAVGVDPEVRADIFQVEIREGDLVLLCSDGLTTMVEDKEIESILKKPEELEKRALELVNQANENGGRDNIAVILIQV